MSDIVKIKKALISVYYKEGLDNIVKKLHDQGVALYSTGGTKKFISDLDIPVTAVEELTSYPSILGGRVKTLHPKIFGGILSRRNNKEDREQVKQYDIHEFDLVIVDLYPFEETVASGSPDQEIIEKIDIGGISLIRAAAKNYKDVAIISTRDQYDMLMNLLITKEGITELEDRKIMAVEAFNLTSHYDTQIFNYFNKDQEINTLKHSIINCTALRYGENPHQKGVFYGKLNELFNKIHGKEISYNNLLDIEAAVYLIDEFKETTFAVLKHNNACGLASRDSLEEAWKDALAGDPVSAFGGILITNTTINSYTAELIDELFFEVVIAPSFEDEALEILKRKKNRIILLRRPCELPKTQFRTLLNGVILQDRDCKMETIDDMTVVTKISPDKREFEDLEFANKIVKHTKSNTIVLAKNKQLIASGVGQTSRVDALKQAITKAGHFGFDLTGAVMASDAFFPFPDCVEIADKEGITSVIQPGGSIRDKESIDYCDQHKMSMVITGTRHFKH